MDLINDNQDWVDTCSTAELTAPKDGMGFEPMTPSLKG